MITQLLHRLLLWGGDSTLKKQQELLSEANSQNQFLAQALDKALKECNDYATSLGELNIQSEQLISEIINLRYEVKQKESVIRTISTQYAELEAKAHRLRQQVKKDQQLILTLTTENKSKTVVPKTTEPIYCEVYDRRLYSAQT